MEYRDHQCNIRRLLSAQYFQYAVRRNSRCGITPWGGFIASQSLGIQFLRAEDIADVYEITDFKLWMLTRIRLGL